MSCLGLFHSPLAAPPAANSKRDQTSTIEDIHPAVPFIDHAQPALPVEEQLGGIPELTVTLATTEKFVAKIPLRPENHDGARMPVEDIKLPPLIDLQRVGEFHGAVQGNDARSGTVGKAINFSGKAVEGPDPVRFDLEIDKTSATGLSSENRLDFEVVV